MLKVLVISGVTYQLVKFMGGVGQQGFSKDVHKKSNEKH